jgi:hypothetical protein
LSAQAARPPTERERAGIVRALPAHWRTRAASSCVSFVIRVSNNGRFAKITVPFLKKPRCMRYASNGFGIAKRITATRWRIVYTGSDPPPCSLGVPRDLLPCVVLLPA